MHIRDPLYGFIELTCQEKSLINSTPFQRLRHIKQLALACYVYPSAIHTRFEHSLGVMYLGDKIASVLKCNKEQKRIIRLAGLVHDIGHGPFSHVSEQILEQFVSEDILNRYSADNAHELISILMVGTNSEIKKIIPGDQRKEICSILCKQQNRNFAKDIISGPLDADKLDYITRDGYFAGVKYGVYDIDKIVEAMSKIRIGRTEETLGINHEGVYALEQMLLCKYHMNAQVYKHRVRRITDAMLVTGIKYALEENIKEVNDIFRVDCNKIEKYLYNYLKYYDIKMFNVILEKGKRKSKGIFKRLWDRKLFKEVFSLEINDRSINDPIVLQNLLDLKEANRKNIAKRISRDIFKKKIPSEFIIVDNQSITNPTFKSPEPKIDTNTIIITDDKGERTTFQKYSKLFQNPSIEPKKHCLYIYAPLDLYGLIDVDKREQFINKYERGIIEIIKGGVS